MKHSNPQKFWKHFRTLKRPSNKRAFNINNKTKSNDISTEFAHHFNYLLNTPRTDSVYPEQESNVNMHEPEHFLISPNEIKTTVTLLKLNKCCDPSNIFAEHIVYSNSEPLYSWLSDCFNQIFESGYVPKALSISTIIPLVKSYKKSLSDPNNYRGISLIPIVTKLLELLIIAKCPVHTIKINLVSKQKAPLYTQLISLKRPLIFTTCVTLRFLSVVLMPRKPSTVVTGMFFSPNFLRREYYLCKLSPL